MAIRAIKFKKTLDQAAGGIANDIFLGDLNTMGMDYPYSMGIDPSIELKRWDNRASQYYGMKRLVKTHDATWSNGSGSSIPDSNLDHAYASKHLKFKQFNRPSEGAKADVDVRGWVNQGAPESKDHWIRDYSDHCLLYFEVQRYRGNPLFASDLKFWDLSEDRSKATNRDLKFQCLFHI